jgi:hypothetical protein
VSKQGRTRTRRWPVARGLIAALVLAALLLVPGGVGAVAPAVRALTALSQTPVRDLDAIATEVAERHRENGGSTVNLYDGDLSGEPLYVVTIYPELTQIRDGPEIDPAAVRAFIERHRALLLDPRNNVGTWFNAEDGRTYLDVSTALADLDLALDLAHRYNQMGIFDLCELEMIDTGGTGTAPADLPPLDQRLPPLP